MLLLRAEEITLEQLHADGTDWGHGSARVTHNISCSGTVGFP